MIDKKKNPNYNHKLKQLTNTFDVYFLYKCVYVCVKYIRTIAYIFMYMSEKVC